MIDLLMGDWSKAFSKSASQSKNLIRIISPFITEQGVQALLSRIKNKTELKIITRMNGKDFLKNVSDIDSLIKLTKDGYRIRAQKKTLHTKIYLFDKSSGIITSSNLTNAGITKNSEVGVLLTQKNKVNELIIHFENVWDALQPDFSIDELVKIRDELNIIRFSSEGSIIEPKGVQDYGRNLSTKSALSIFRKKPSGYESEIEMGKTKWLKFMWRRSQPAPLNFDLVKKAKNYGSITFPKHPGRPNNIKLGDQIYHTALTYTEKGRDWLIFGQGEVAMEHRPGVDELNMQLRKKIPDIGKYPFLVWLCNIVLIRGTVGVGVSLHELFNELKDKTFIWSYNQAKKGKPGRYQEAIRYYRSHIQLSEEATDLLNYLLEKKYAEYGKISIASGKGVWWNDFLTDKNIFRKIL